MEWVFLFLVTVDKRVGKVDVCTQHSIICGRLLCSRISERERELSLVLEKTSFVQICFFNYVEAIASN